MGLDIFQDTFNQRQEIIKMINKLYLDWHKWVSKVCYGDDIITLKELGKMTQ